MANSYRHTLKATITLSGAQLIEAIMSLIRAKVIAIIMGPVGIALNSIFLTTTNTIFQASSLGLPQSGVRDISASYTSNDSDCYIRTVTIFSTLMRWLAILSIILCIAISPILNTLSFGYEENHTQEFCILAFGLGAMIMSYSNITILQSTQQLTALAKTTIYAALLSILFAIPLFILYGKESIVWAIVIGYFITLALNTYFTKRLNIPRQSIPVKTIISEASPMIKLGLIIMISSFIINLYTYLTNVFIREFGSLSDVGYYQAAYSVTMRNFAILSSVLVADFYPRLSAAVSKHSNYSKIISEQAEMLLLFVSIITVLIITFSPIIIKLLFTEEFLKIDILVKCLAFSFLFRSLWLTVAYIALAEGDRNTFLKYDAIIGNGFCLITTIISYYYFGLAGMGIASIISSIFVAGLLTIIYTRKYNFSISRSYYSLLAKSIVLTLFIMLSGIMIDNGIIKFIIVTLFFIPYTLFTYNEINKRIDIKNYIKQRTRK